MNPYSAVTCSPYSPKQEIPVNQILCLEQQCSCPGGATVGGCFPYPTGECHQLFSGPLPEPGPNVGYTPMWDPDPCGGTYPGTTPIDTEIAVEEETNP